MSKRKRFQTDLESKFKEIKINKILLKCIHPVLIETFSVIN